MAPEHPPREVELVLKSLGREPATSTILYQNVDQIYWQS